MDTALRPLTNTSSNQQEVNSSPVMSNSYHNFSPKLTSDSHSRVYTSLTSFEDYLTIASDIHSEELKRYF